VSIRIDEARRERLVVGLRGFFLEQFDQELSTFRAEMILDHVLAAVGPQVYNQAVQDARRFMLQKLEDLEGDVHEPEGLGTETA
jgi:uncharacterized protein (DUF2164 family)